MAQEMAMGEGCQAAHPTEGETSIRKSTHGDSRGQQASEGAD